MAPPAKKRFGQHFLSDRRILGRIADALAPTPADRVLEIGPGPGGLTAHLADRTPHLVAIEKDRDLVPALRARFGEAAIVEGDALDLDWHRVSGVPDGTRGIVPDWLVTGNIPYNITTPLIDRALQAPLPARIVFLVQKEVAERVAAGPGSKEYGALTVGVQGVARVERLFTVPAGAFQPPPKVDSAVLRLTPLEAPLVPERERAGFRTFVVGLFGFRRKQLARGLRELTGWDVERVGAALGRAGLAPTVRPEVLAPADFARLHGALVDAGWETG